MRLSTKLMAGLCGAAGSLIVGGAISSAAPEDAIINSTCTYPQVMAALNAQSPEQARTLSSNLAANAWLQSLIASPPEQRQQMVNQVRNVPEVQQYGPLIGKVAATCNNF